MTAEPQFWDRVRELFHACAEADPATRGALLDGADAGVRTEVESLLAEHDGADGFLDRSVWEMARDASLPPAIGPYRVIRRIGEGGMGTVLLAAREDKQFEQLVAIKLVRQAAGGTQLLRRFRQERQILAALAHPNIARLLDGGETAGGLPYLVMEYVEGTPLDVYCREHELPTAARLRLFLSLCDAVQYAHRNLIIHRDIKPGNVLVTSDGVPKLLDFGIAKLTSEQASSDATVTRMMTPDYASPEQLDGRPVTTASDVYSLGVLLFELLTGKRPFTGQVRRDAPRPSSMTGATVLRGDLDHILLVALDPDPERRYGSVENFANDVRRHLDGRPVSARGASLGYRAAKFARRNKFIVGAAAAALLVAVVSFIAVVQQKRIAERRFEQVRSLAHSVVFDIHDAIAPLSGSTAARRLLVQRALVYLDGLAGESSDNTSLELELAGAYERIGDVQGMPYRPNLGEGSAALTSYRKARAIAGRVCAREPGNEPAHALLAELYDRAGLLEQRALQYDTALHDHQTARALRDALPHRGAPGDLAQARTWVAIADCIYLSSSIRPVAAEQNRTTVREAYETALFILARVPHTAQYERDLLMETGRAHQRLGGYFTGVWEHDPQRALVHHQAALAALAERARLDPTDAVSRRNYADQQVMTATLQNRNGDPQAAITLINSALTVLRDLAAADADNVEAQHDLAFAYEELGLGNVKLGRYPDAQRAYDDALRIRERLFSRDPTNREERRGIYALYSAKSGLERQRGNAALAAEYREKAAAIFAELRK